MWSFSPIIYDDITISLPYFGRTLHFYCGFEFGNAQLWRAHRCAYQKHGHLSIAKNVCKLSGLFERKIPFWTNGRFDWNVDASLQIFYYLLMICWSGCLDDSRATGHVMSSWGYLFQILLDKHLNELVTLLGEIWASKKEQLHYSGLSMVANGMEEERHSRGQ